MNPARQIIQDGWISVTGNLIDGIGEGNYMGPAPAVEHINGHHGVLMPGMISTHQHVIDSLIRGGLEVDRGLFDWLVNVYYAGTSAYTPDDCAIAAKLNVSEAISSGVTTITDNWGVNNGDDPIRVNECAQATIEMYKTTGIRMMFARMFSDTFPDYWGPLVGALLQKVPGIVLNPATLVEPTEDALTRIEALMNQHHGSENGRISVCPGPILPQTVTPQGHLGSLALAEQFDTIVALHHCESETDARIFRESGPGLSCTDYLNCIGGLHPRLLGSHCVHLDDRDIRYFKVHDCKISHCPSSNMFLASGIAPVPKFLAAGLTVGLGTDDTNTNSNISILTEMRNAALVQKGHLRDAGAMTAEKVLEMATIDGARAIGLQDQIGSLEVGKKADIVLFNTNRPWWYPRHHLPSVIVYQAHADDVRTVLIDGQVILRNRELSFLPNADRRDFFEAAQAASAAIVERAGMQALANRGWQSLSRV
ncbi:amidohydrolase [Paraliomyxa miuraensis]|uniref:amidohydrolase n=1 Tax=Paraliomyxa miuraensis TaxID=376150 RepID=UPI00224E8549|nr:amidohydrolase [Paraliomyxa miuraensis]MCX4240620.1 amidohydrolase [Paraliomyxa miuraensis]